MSQVDVVSQVNVSPHPRKQGDISVGIINRRAELVRANQEKARKEFAEARRTCCNGRRLSG